MHRYCALVLRSPDPAVERVPCGPTPRNTAIGPDAEIRGRGKITGRATRRSPLHGSCRSGLSETGYWIVEPAAATGMMRDASSVRLIWSVGRGPAVGGSGGLPRGFLPVFSALALRAASLA